MMKHKILLSLFFLFGTLANAACPDFTNLNSPSVTAFTGNTSDPFAAQGVVDGRHTLINAQGTDPNTGGVLNLLPAGASQVIRLGNDEVGAEAEALSYRFTVDVDNAVLLLKFAVVLEDPGHPSIEQPRFVVRITDSEGNLTETCAEYDVSASADLPGFQTFQKNGYQAIRWRDWTNVGLDLSKHIGKEVQLQFITYDCSPTAHFGYAYFTASCMSNLLQLKNCGTPFDISAPEGFESYLWDNGATTQTVSRTETEGGISCTVTSATGCQFTLNGYISAAPPTTPANIQTTICEGETYTENYFDLPPQLPGKHKYYNTFINPASCSTQTSELELDVIQRYNYFKAAICHGEDYKANGFEAIQPPVGVWRDTIQVGNIADCPEYNILELTVSANLNMPNIIQGESKPCTGEVFTYTFAGAESLTFFEWIIPENAVLYKSSRYAQTIQLYFTDDKAAVLQLSGENGCGKATTQLNIAPRQTYAIQLSEEVCQGESFDKYDFNLGVQNTVGYFVQSKHLTSSLGCDSVVTLALNVLPTPIVRIEPKNAVLCNPGEEITLWALTEGMEYPGNGTGNGGGTGSYIACGDYEEWYSTLTPEDEADFTGGYSPGSNVATFGTYSGTNTTVIIPTKIANGYTLTNINGTVFNDIPVTEVVLPPTVTLICDYSFANMPTLTYLTIPKSVTQILDTGGTLGLFFADNPNMIIRCYENSVIHQYCLDNNIKFELIGDCVNGEEETFASATIYDCTLDYLWNTAATEGAITVQPTETTEYDVLVTTQNGCSAKATQRVVVNSSEPVVVDAAICKGDTYSDYGITESETGVYHTTIENEDCDIPVTVNLTVNEPQETVIEEDICAGAAFKKHNFDITLYQEGLFEETYNFIGKNGCDSLVVLKLNVTAAENVVLRDTVCQYLPYNGNGFTLPEQEIAGEFSFERPSTTALGCNNTTTLKLTVNPVITNTISDEANFGEAYNKYNFSFEKVSKDMTETKHEKSAAGCDSIVVLNLRVNMPPCTPVYETVPQIICENDLPFAWRDTTFRAGTQSGDYVFKRKTVHTNCDSIVTLQLTVNPFLRRTVDKTICEGTSYDFYGTTVSEAVSGLEHRFANENSCDSIISLNLTVSPFLRRSIKAEICSGESFDFYGTSLDASVSGLEHRFPNAIGCDSLVTLNLTVKSLPPAPTVVPVTYCVGATASTLSAAGSHLQWFDSEGRMLDAAPIPQTEVAGVSSYFVSQEISGCTSPQAEFPVTVIESMSSRIIAQNEAGTTLLNNSSGIKRGVRLEAVSVDGNNPNSFLWSWDNHSTTDDHEIWVYPAKTTTYNVLASTDNGCEATAEITINVIPFPNSFVPSLGEGHEWGEFPFDTYAAEQTKIRYSEMVIYNRYGQEVYKGIDSASWNGVQHNGKLAAPGTYFYTITFDDGERMNGTVEVLK